MSDGRRPWIWLPPTPNVSNEDRLKIEGGIVPDNLFSSTRKFKSLVNWPKESGIIPPKLFSDTINTSRNERFPKKGGILRVRLFFKMLKYRSFDKVQKDEACEDGGDEHNWESPMQSRSWYEWVLVFRNKTDLGLTSLLNAQGKAHL